MEEPSALCLQIISITYGVKLDQLLKCLNALETIVRKSCIYKNISIYTLHGNWGIILEEK